MRRAREGANEMETPVVIFSESSAAFRFASSRSSQLMNFPPTSVDPRGHLFRCFGNAQRAGSGGRGGEGKKTNEKKDKKRIEKKSRRETAGASDLVCLHSLDTFLYSHHRRRRRRELCRDNLIFRTRTKRPSRPGRIRIKKKIKIKKNKINKTKQNKTTRNKTKCAKINLVYY